MIVDLTKDKTSATTIKIITKNKIYTHVIMMKQNGEIELVPDRAKNTISIKPTMSIPLVQKPKLKAKVKLK